MKVLFCTTILVISISAVYCISPPNGTCANTAYHYCDWAGWGTWSNCSNQCGSGTQERKRFICCPPEYNASSILQCVQQLCPIISNISPAQLAPDVKVGVGKFNLEMELQSISVLWLISWLSEPLNCKKKKKNLKCRSLSKSVNVGLHNQT